MKILTPKEIMEELNRFIIGQNKAKKAVSIALRNRWRRQMIPKELRDEVAPKNIIMIGPTGVGKTEIARRLARLAEAPFIKVEASKFTEVGYVGRDVESIIRDLTDLAVAMVRTEHTERVQDKAEEAAQDRLLDLLFPKTSIRNSKRLEIENVPGTVEPMETETPEERQQRTREKLQIHPARAYLFLTKNRK